MRISAGSQIGPYEVLAPLGSGGMGEVWSARDPRLDRNVAIKILPDLVEHDPDRLARFEREAKTLAALNHPHIAAIYGLEDSPAGRAIVMELVDGETLADRITRGPVPLDEALAIARQIADALDAAHERDIVHRDLKPANIKLTADGAVKVLDFGLAKLAQPVAAATPALSVSPTVLSPAMTHMGVILGTAAYMAPEQARGKPVDKRADIWAFGVVLYEMVTGRRLFEGETVSDTLASVLTRAPEWDRVPMQMLPLLRRCLEKDPKRRLRDIGDAWTLMDATPSESGTVSRSGAPPWAGVAALMTLVAGVALWAPWRANPAAPQLLRFQVPPPAGTTFAQDVDDPPVVSPDGKRLAFLAMGQDGRSRIWIKDLDSLDARRLDGTEEAHWLIWSPDGRWMAFNSGNTELKKVPVAGGPPQTLCSCDSILKAAWSKGGAIIFGNAQGIMKVSEQGGDVTALTKVDSSRGEIVHTIPSFLPDGRHFLYARVGMQEGFLYVASLDAKPGEQPLNRVLDTFAQYASGRLLFLRSGALMSQAFDVERLAVSGEATQLVQYPQTQPPISGNGMLAYGGALPPAQLTWFSRQGTPLGTIGKAEQSVSNPRVSPDDLAVAFNRYDAGPGNVWIYEPKRGDYQFTYFNDSERPIWSPDGSHVAYSLLVGGGTHLVQRAANGVGNEDVLHKSDAFAFLHDWSRDGKYLLFGVYDPKNKMDVWVLPLSGDRKPFPYSNKDFNEAEPRLSPNGKWLAYIADPLGHYEVYVDTFTGDASAASSRTRGTWSISTGGGTRPIWSRDGKELFFISADRKMMAVQVNDADGTRFDFSAPRPLFDARISGSPWEQFDVSRDGRFLMFVPVTQTASEPITVIVNWTEATKK